MMVSEKRADGLLNIPVKGARLWIEELRDGRLVINSETQVIPSLFASRLKLSMET